ncbi:MAG: NUDIX domain-containing protein [Thermoflavifilum sp.]|nr:NUDIX domain-containing protein [Thermoflavifilum sp.]
MEPIVIWIQDAPFIICRQLADIPDIVLPASQRQGALIETSTANIVKTIPEMLDGQARARIILTEDVDHIFRQATAMLSWREAAGGLVTNTDEEVLLIFRRGKWDLPKGKIETGDSPEQTALREVYEETGLSHLEIQHFICHTYHVYVDRYTGQQTLKKTHWFQMKFTGTELTVPQIEEDIIDIQWIKPIHLEKYLRYSYGTIRYVCYQSGFIKTIVS